jgi:hypothetical protein
MATKDALNTPWGMRSRLLGRTEETREERGATSPKVPGSE